MVVESNESCECIVVKTKLLKPFGHFATETNKRTRDIIISIDSEKKVARYSRKVFIKDMAYQNIFKQGNEI